MATEELQAPGDHPAVCWKLCDPTFENAPHVHTPQGVFIVDIINPKSERGQQMIRNAAYMKPITQGDPPPPDARIATCPNGHGLMKRVVAPLAPGAAAFESWECETCHIEKMWPDPAPTHLPRRPLVTDVTPSAVEWTFTEYGGNQRKVVVVLTKEQALHIKEYLTATSERGQPLVGPIAENRND